MTHMRFIGKSSSENLSGGLEYFAAGLVLSCHMDSGAPNQSGKDYAVEYIDPFGTYQAEWRAADEIVTTPISDADYDHLKSCYAAAAKKTGL